MAEGQKRKNKESWEIFRQGESFAIQGLLSTSASGGMKQRVAIAKGMALGSKIIMMDEPFAALDAMTRNQMRQNLCT